MRDAVAALLAGSAVALATAIAILAQGSSLRGLLHGVLIEPLQLPQLFSVPIHWRSGAGALALSSLALAGVAAGWGHARLCVAIAALRLAALLCYVAAWIFPGPIFPYEFAMSYALACVWLFVFPIGADAATQPARSWLALLLIPQALHAYPVAGSQIAWGTFLWVPLAAIAAHDVFARFTASSPARRRAFSAAAIAVLLGLSYRCIENTRSGVTRALERAPLQLPGAEALRLPEGLASALRIVTKNAAAHADLLFSVPGMQSFHLWTELPLPSSINEGIAIQNAEQQAATRAGLLSSPRACVIVQRERLRILAQSGVVIDPSFMAWLSEHFEPAFTLHTYELWVRKGRAIAAIGTASARRLATIAARKVELSLTLDHPELRDITSIELARFEGGTTAREMSWSGAEPEITVTPLDPTGEATGPASEVSFPFSIDGLARVDLRVESLPAKFPFAYGVIYLRDSRGSAVAEARFAQEHGRRGD
jgi:hypothetical protein